MESVNNLNGLVIRDWYWEEGLNTTQITRRLVNEYKKALHESVKLMEEAEIQDEEIAGGLTEYPLQRCVLALSEAGWTPDKIYSGLISEWSGANELSTLYSLRFVLGLRWAEIADISERISRIPPEDLFHELRTQYGLYKVRTRLFVRVWPECDKDSWLEDYLEEGEVTCLLEASSMALALFGELKKKLNHKLSGGLKQALWQVRVSFEDRLGEERVGCEIRRIEDEENKE